MLFLTGYFEWQRQRHSDVIKIKLIFSTHYNIPTKRIFRIFHMMNIIRMMPFCKLSMERPLYMYLRSLSGSEGNGKLLTGLQRVS